MPTSPAFPGAFVPDWPLPAGVRALVSTRAGGISGAPYVSLNLGSHVGDSPDSVSANRALLAAQMGSAPRYLDQVHGVRVIDFDRWADGDSLQADAAVSSMPGRPCLVQVADCLPLLLASADGKVVGAAHCGWRGLAAGVAQATLAAMREKGADQVTAYLGPAIGPTAFEVGAEVRAAFVEQRAEHALAFTDAEPGKYLASLFLLARQVLAAENVPAVFSEEHCTFSQPERFFSFRRDRITGRQAAVVWIE